MPEVVNVLIAIALFTILSAMLAALIYFCSRIFYVKEDPRFDFILKNLPGANCGGCGHPGCSGFANSIIKDGTNPRNCKPIKQEYVDIIDEYIKKTTGPNREYIGEEA